MKQLKYMFFICFFAFVSQVFSHEDLQDVVENEQSEDIQTIVETKVETKQEISGKVDLSPFLLKNGLMEKGFYHTPNGMPVKYRQVREMVSPASGNESLLKRERAWRVTARTFMGIFFTSTAVVFATSFADDDTFNKIDAINDNVFELSLFSWILTGIVANVKLQKAVDNYNYRLTRSER